jgi:ABC-type multidrug transport system permease subunit
MSKNLKISVVLSILFITTIRSNPIWERYPGGFWNLLFYLIIAGLFFWLIIRIIKDATRIIKHREILNFSNFIPIMVMILSLLDGIFNPFQIDLDSIYGQVHFRACYEGTQNQATFKFRENGKFDIHWTGFFFMDGFFTGEYKRTGGNIFLSFDAVTPGLLGDTLVIRDEYLYKVEQDTIIPTYFYLGYCKGLN